MGGDPPQDFAHPLRRLVRPLELPLRPLPGRQVGDGDHPRLGVFGRFREQLELDVRDLEPGIGPFELFHRGPFGFADTRGLRLYARGAFAGDQLP